MQVAWGHISVLLVRQAPAAPKDAAKASNVAVAAIGIYMRLPPLQKAPPARARPAGRPATQGCARCCRKGAGA
jgi:hypothetical protein